MGRLLEQARDRAARTRRELAAEMGVAPATVSEAERGRNPRYSTLRAYLSALPSLSPDSLLSTPRECAPEASPAAWLFHREHVGIVAASFCQSTRVSTDGSAERTTMIHGLRSIRGTLKDAVERTVVLAMAAESRKAVVKQLRKNEDRPGRGTWSISDGDQLHEYVFRPGLDQHGVTYRRGEPSVGLDRTTPGELPPPFERGVHVRVRFPVDTLELEVVLPPGPTPNVRAHAWLAGLGVGPGDVGILEELHPAGLPVQVREARGGDTHVTLRIERPLLGLCYGLGWSTDS
ncbi:MAG: helix-turn-helix transcriptional regulator [Acidobacteriota bacterium]